MGVIARLCRAFGRWAFLVCSAAPSTIPSTMPSSIPRLSLRIPLRVSFAHLNGRGEARALTRVWVMDAMEK